MARADHFFVWRHHHGVPYQHHGIDLGDGTVIHFTDGGDGVAGPGGSRANFVIRRTPIEVVTRDGRDRVHVIRHRSRLDDETIIDRAISQVGRTGYHLVFDNCEHFACWCVIDREESRQIGIAHERLSAAGVKALASVTMRTASRMAAKQIDACCKSVDRRGGCGTVGHRSGRTSRRTGRSEGSQVMPAAPLAG